LLSKGLKEIGTIKSISTQEVWRILTTGSSNPTLLCGVALEAVFFGALLYLLSQRDVSLIWPLTSLGFVITAFASKLILHEQIPPLRWAGVLLIVVGAGLITYSEKQQARAAKDNPAGTSVTSRPK